MSMRAAVQNFSLQSVVFTCVSGYYSLLEPPAPLVTSNLTLLFFTYPLSLSLPAPLLKISYQSTTRDSSRNSVFLVVGEQIDG